MTDPAQVMALNAMGVEFCGFIFYPKSPRYIYRHVPMMEVKKIKGKINKVGVFVNAEPDEVIKTVDDCGLYLVQLHGDESPKKCEKIAEYITVIKAFRIGEDENILWKVRDYKDVVDMYLFDTEGAGYGGTGKKFDWGALLGLNLHKPFILSGGIQPSDVALLREFRKDPVAKDLFAIDINSKFELEKGIKDLASIQRFIDEIRSPEAT